MSLQRFLLLLYIAICFSANANPAPLGFELNRSTMSDIEKQYNVTIKEENYWEGNNYHLDIRNAKLDGLTGLLVICDKSDIIQSVILTVDKDKFTEFYNLLSEKYILVEKELPTLGHRRAKFTDDQSIIIIEAPCFRFDMSIVYVTKDFYTKFQDKKRQEETEKKVKYKAIL